MEHNPEERVFKERKQAYCNICGCTGLRSNVAGKQLTCGHTDIGWRTVSDDGIHKGKTQNIHPTVKPLKLMSYLITLGSREGDVALDPFIGSGTTALASKMLGRKCLGIELEEKYCEIATNRCRQQVLL